MEQLVLYNYTNTMLHEQNQRTLFVPNTQSLPIVLPLKKGNSTSKIEERLGLQL
jgi:hypothetical protein